MKTNLAHTIRLNPTKSQETFFKKACGCARVAYNYGLAEYKKLLDAKEKPNIFEIKKKFNQDKKTLFPWMSETNKDANQRPFTNLKSAFTRFFKKQSKFPKFHKKGVKDSFYISNDKFSVEGNRFTIPRLGWVKGTEELRFKGKIMSAVVKRKSSYWFIVISVETETSFIACNNQAAVGIDLGVNTLATLSNGLKVESSKPLKKKLARLKRLQRNLSRKVKGSGNRKKQQLKLSKLHYEIACIRKDGLDKLTTSLCHNFKIICIEDLNVKGMLKNHCLARAISDAGFGEFKRQLTYKSKLYGNTVVMVDRFYPSSKTCSVCGYKKETLSLSERDFHCECCGNIIDRDLNAAINILNEGLRILNKIGAVSPELTPMDKKALIDSDINETILAEVGISECSLLNT